LRPTIDPNGDVLICLDHCIGNIRKKNFREIWTSPIANNFRESLKSIEKFPICTRCCELYARPNIIFSKKMQLNKKHYSIYRKFRVS